MNKKTDIKKGITVSGVVNDERPNGVPADEEGVEVNRIVNALTDFGFEFGPWEHSEGSIMIFEIDASITLPFLKEKMNLVIFYQSDILDYVYHFILKTGDNELTEEQAGWILYYIMNKSLLSCGNNMNELIKNIITGRSISEEKLEFSI